MAELPPEERDDDTVPEDQGVPSWYGPDYHPTDRAIKAFAEPPPGAELDGRRESQE